jgi:CRP-like cAMP-binding protein
MRWWKTLANARAIAVDHGIDKQPIVPGGRPDIADYFGLTSETVTRTLRELRARDCIRVHCREIDILHRGVLDRLAQVLY